MSQAARPAQTWRIAVIAGACIGLVYVLSPLTVWFTIAAAVILRFAARDLPADERRWVHTVLVLAIGIRVAAVLGLFLSSATTKLPFVTFFGDEEFFIRRSIWLRNVALDIPVHSADLIYAFDEVGQTSYLYLLALIQLFVGASPYGVHLVSITFYLVAAVLLFRLVASTLGRIPAMIGLALLMFLPSLFAWSISALKEPFYFLLTTIGIVVTVKFARSSDVKTRLVSLAVLAALLLGVESVRRAGAVLMASSLIAGAVLAWIVSRPRVFVVAVVVLPIAVGATFGRPAAQVRAAAMVRRAAWQHAAHINTPGIVYKTLEDRYYQNNAEIYDMGFRDAARFVTRSLVDYVLVPLPWDVQSPTALAYVPEQIVWYVLVALLPAGLLFSFRCDSLVASLLIAHGVASAGLVAITSGNVGTLIRHRGMAVPYLLWLSATGGCHLVDRAVNRTRPALSPALD